MLVDMMYEWSQLFKQDQESFEDVNTVKYHATRRHTKIVTKVEFAILD